MQEISKAVQEGAMAYLKQQYSVVGLVFVAVFALLAVLSFGLHLISVFVPFAFITGGFFSGLSGFIGMSVATRANCRTAAAAKESLNSGLRVAFSAGTVMGMTVVGLGLLDLSIWWTLLRYVFQLPDRAVPPIMITFGMGAIARWRCSPASGGGIFTKAADVGADLVGKVEAGIPEDDPRNPAVDRGQRRRQRRRRGRHGRGPVRDPTSARSSPPWRSAPSAASRMPGVSTLQAIQVPISIATIGVICSIIGTFFVRAKGDVSQKVLLRALRSGVLHLHGADRRALVHLHLVHGGQADDRRLGSGHGGPHRRERHRVLHGVLHL